MCVLLLPSTAVCFTQCANVKLTVNCYEQAKWKAFCWLFAAPTPPSALMTNGDLCLCFSFTFTQVFSLQEYCLLYLKRFTCFHRDIADYQFSDSASVNIIVAALETNFVNKELHELHCIDEMHVTLYNTEPPLLHHCNMSLWKAWGKPCTLSMWTFVRWSLDTEVVANMMV